MYSIDIITRKLCLRKLSQFVLMKGGTENSQGITHILFFMLVFLVQFDKTASNTKVWMKQRNVTEFLCVAKWHPLTLINTC